MMRPQQSVQAGFISRQSLIILGLYILLLISIPLIALGIREQRDKANILAKGNEVKKVVTVPTPTNTPTNPPAGGPTPTKSAKTSAVKSTVQTPKTPGIPVRINIPKIGMNAAVEQVGMGADGSMEVPSSWWTVGWYKLGYKVGDPGSAVMSGHYDTNTGAPAVFFRVGQLNPGDIITVTNTNGAILKFRVFEKQTYPFDQLPMQRIFASAGKATLNLITCSGTWDKATKNYSHRTVIYSELTN